MAAEPADDRLLRDKYLDWCSAQVVDRFLKLTPDEIYQLAHQAPAGGGEAGSQAGSRAVQPAGKAVPPLESATHQAAVLSPPEPIAPGLSYRALVQRVTEALTASMALPPFDRWVAAYRAAPERFESELLGFWKDGEPRRAQ